MIRQTESVPIFNSNVTSLNSSLLSSWQHHSLYLTIVIWLNQFYNIVLGCIIFMIRAKRVSPIHVIHRGLTADSFLLSSEVFSASPYNNVITAPLPSGHWKLCLPQDPLCAPRIALCCPRDASTSGLRHPSGSIMQSSGRIMGPSGGIISIVPLGGVQ